MSKTIVIQGQSFEVNTPYSEGHTLTEVEAKVLNQTRCENIRNNMAKQVKELVEKNDLAAASAAVKEYDDKYEFSMVRGGGTRRTMDPVERAARSLAREAIKAKLASEGRKLKDVDPEKLEEAIEKVAAQDEFLKAARKQVAEKQKLAEQAGESLAAE